MKPTAYRIDRHLRETGRRLRTVSTLALTACLVIGPAHAAESTARGAILAVVDGLFDGMREKSEGTLRAQFAPDASVGSGTVDSFVSAVLSSQAHLDEVTFDETVLVDGDLAMAWTPYNIFVDGAFHHCGVDLFVMKRLEGRWKITALEDTRRTDGCDTGRRE